MSLTKQGIHRHLIKVNGLSSGNDNVGFINLFLYNLVLKGIVGYNLITLSEKKSINMILEGRHQRYYYDQRTKQIKHRSSKMKEGHDK